MIERRVVRGLQGDRDVMGDQHPHGITFGYDVVSFLLSLEPVRRQEIEIPMSSYVSRSRFFKDSAAANRFVRRSLPMGPAAIFAGSLFGMVVLGFGGAVAAQETNRPNILLIMADDIGIEGLGCYGGTSYPTPHLDRLAAEGVRFTHAYSQPLCTPTRVQIMTGRYNHRNWKYFGILDPEAETFGHALQEVGYKTGIFGKWQLQSYDPPDLPGAGKRRGTGMHPKDAGFDRYALFHALHTEDKGSRYANPTMLEGVAGEQGVTQTYVGEYGEDVWVEKIVDFFDQHREEPTFVYYAMALPHWPFEPTPDSQEWNPNNTPAESIDYFDDMVRYMDKSVGELLRGLEQKGLRENTLVIFYSDNGTHLKVESNLADGRTIRGGKATPLQTGIHVPLIAHWPGRIEPSVCDDLVDASDFFPTLLEVAGEKPAAKGERDGVSFAAQMLGGTPTPRGAAFFWYDARPGWDKERFSRHVFALNHDYKVFQDGRLFRLTERPLEEIEVAPLEMSDADRAARQDLLAVIEDQLAGVELPPRVDAYGNPEHDFAYLPSDRKETDAINDELLAGGEEHSYGELQEQKVWVFPPLGASQGERFPTVFLVHGGSWGGHPRLLAPQAVYLQRRGYTAVIAHFQPPDRPRSKVDGAELVTPHDTLRDVRAAYRWMIENSEKCHVDTGQIVVGGGSAGGHLSLAMCTIELPDDPVVDPQPRGLVLLNPVIDMVEGWLGGRRRCLDHGIDPKSFSPAYHVRPGLPETLVLSGEKDELISPALIRAFGERMKSNGNPFSFVEYPDAGHGFFNYGRGENVHFRWTMWEIENFLRRLR